MSNYKIKDRQLSEKYLSAKNITGKNIVILGDSNARLWQNSGLIEGSTYDCTIQKLAVDGATFAETGNSILAQLNNIQGTPDYIIVWCGNNDIRNWTQGTLGKPQIAMNTPVSDYNTGTALGAQNKLLLTLRNTYPTTKVIGVIRTFSADILITRSQYMWFMYNKIYQKWNVPVINIDKTGNITQYVQDGSWSQYFTDNYHYNTAGLQIINDKIVNAIATGYTEQTEIECHTYYHDSNLDLLSLEGRTTLALDLANNYFMTERSETSSHFFTKRITSFNGTNRVTTFQKTDSGIHIYMNAMGGDLLEHWRISSSGEVLKYEVLSDVILQYDIEQGQGCDVLTLPVGDYMVRMNAVPEMVNLPSEMYTAGCGCLLSVRQYSSGPKQIRCESYFGYSWQNNGGTYWRQDLKTDGSVTMSGVLTFKNSTSTNQTKLIQYGGSTHLRNQIDDKNYRDIYLSPNSYPRFLEIVDGVQIGNYRFFGEHNKELLTSEMYLFEPASGFSRGHYFNYFKDADGLVTLALHISGSFNSKTNLCVGTMPVGFRPFFRVINACILTTGSATDVSVGYFEIKENGEVYISNPTSTNRTQAFMLITFKAGN